MRAEIPLLQNVRVAAPCPADWNEMAEVDGDRVKFCSGCQKRVYNLSAIGQAEAEGLLRKHEGHLCVRYYRRTDGTVLTTDCPVGLKAMQALAFRRTKFSFALCALFSIGVAAYRSSQPQPLIGSIGDSAVFIDKNNVATPITEERTDSGWITGGMALTSEPVRIATKNVSPLSKSEENQATKKSPRKPEKHE